MNLEKIVMVGDIVISAESFQTRIFKHLMPPLFFCGTWDADERCSCQIMQFSSYHFRFHRSNQSRLSLFNIFYWFSMLVLRDNDELTMSSCEAEMQHYIFAQHILRSILSTWIQRDRRDMSVYECHPCFERSSELLRRLGSCLSPSDVCRRWWWPISNDPRCTLQSCGNSSDAAGREAR